MVARSGFLPCSSQAQLCMRYRCGVLSLQTPYEALETTILAGARDDFDAASSCARAEQKVPPRQAAAEAGRPGNAVVPRDVGALAQTEGGGGAVRRL